MRLNFEHLVKAGMPGFDYSCGGYGGDGPTFGFRSEENKDEVEGTPEDIGSGGGYGGNMSWDLIKTQVGFCRCGGDGSGGDGTSLDFSPEGSHDQVESNLEDSGSDVACGGNMSRNLIKTQTGVVGCGGDGDPGEAPPLDFRSEGNDDQVKGTLEDIGGSGDCGRNMSQIHTQVGFGGCGGDCDGGDRPSLDFRSVGSHNQVEGNLNVISGDGDFRGNMSWNLLMTQVGLGGRGGDDYKGDVPPLESRSEENNDRVEGSFKDGCGRNISCNSLMIQVNVGEYGDDGFEGDGPPLDSQYEEHHHQIEGTLKDIGGSGECDLNNSWNIFNTQVDFGGSDGRSQYFSMTQPKQSNLRLKSCTSWNNHRYKSNFKFTVFGALLFILSFLGTSRCEAAGRLLRNKEQYANRSQVIKETRDRYASDSGNHNFQVTQKEEKNNRPHSVLETDYTFEMKLDDAKIRRLQVGSFIQGVGSLSDYCLTTPNVYAKMQECENNDDQLYLYDEKNRYIKFEGNCLDHQFVANHIYFHSCHGGPNQRWYYNKKTMEMKNLGGERCLDIRGNKELHMYDCHGGDNQKFQMPSTWTMSPLSVSLPI
mmetsp:Transcript_21041/g.44228  ORF Transcript_21041/g.44228 Transcript_21041/m.44228 type:complete len:591 (+) Transcript_21041:140-1912(+)